MKKLLSIVLCLVLMVSLVACGSGDWKDVLADYEEFIDEYIEAMKDGEDLTDLDLEGEAWTTKIEELAETLEGDELEEFKTEAARITMKVVTALGGSDVDLDLG